MRIFLTGGTGFIGSHFVRHAINSGHEVVALRRPGAISRIPLEREPEWHDGHLTDDLRELLNGCDSFVHLAAYGVTAGAADWEGCFAVNLHHSLHLWRQAVSKGIRRFLIAGSCFEYGRSGELYERIPVKAPLQPTTAYGASKAAATVAAHALAVEHQLQLVVARPFHVYGEGEEPNRFWPSLVEAAHMGMDFPMTGGEQIRDFQPVSETVSQLLAWLINPLLKPGATNVVNLGAGKSIELRTFAQLEWSRLEARGSIIFGSIPYRKNEVMHYVPEVTDLNFSGD